MIKKIDHNTLFDTSNPDNELGPFVVAVVGSLTVIVISLILTMFR